MVMTNPAAAVVWMLLRTFRLIFFSEAYFLGTLIRSSAGDFGEVRSLSGPNDGA